MRDAVKDAFVLVRLHINPPYWWLRDNPDECVVYRTKDRDINGTDDGEQDRLIRNDAEQMMRVSLASKKWINDACEKLSELLDKIKLWPEYDMLLGVQIAGGIYGEWHQWGTDVSKPMQDFFKKYLSHKYKTVDALRAAWQNNSVDFENAEFRPEMFRSGDDGLFRNPAVSQNTIDSQEAIMKSTTDAILRFCRVAKEKMPDKIVGTFYGYYFGVGGDKTTIGGHLMPELIYEASDVIDFMCGPFCYLKNRHADAVSRAELYTIAFMQVI